MTDEAKGKGKHVGGKIKEGAGELLGDREMKREGQLDQQAGEAEQDAARAEKRAEKARKRATEAEIQKERTD